MWRSPSKHFLNVIEVKSFAFGFIKSTTFAAFHVSLQLTSAIQISRVNLCALAAWPWGLWSGQRDVSQRPFTVPELAGTKWAFPTAPSAPVTCNDGAIMNSWFDICNAPITSKSVRGLDDVLESVQKVHAIIDKEISDGTDPGNIFIAGLSQGGAMAIGSVLLYPNTLGGGAVFSGFLPFNSPVEDRIFPQAKKTPILWCHGMLDTLVPFEAGEDGKEFLQKLGMNCEFKAYDGLGHSLDEMELEYFQEWLKHQLGRSSKKSHFSACGLFNKFCS
ncbi:Acyl-protein thioesterase 1 [Rhynchospora pubera]|uniref:Acyl-protein thioesterase 1 n=1 Tax=Rhynchospora pubera TaxID=906938 RepID=A0AAV8EWQ0_9POAL|nr:Acyl-protein thioesterase 1 [Rhynchospora pubera]